MTVFTWFPDPGELADWIDARRDMYARHQYQTANLARWRRDEPLLPEFDLMTEEERVSAGLYVGHDPMKRPAHVSPVTWELGQQEHARRHGAPRDLSRAEIARGYDIHSKAVDGTREDHP